MRSHTTAIIKISISALHQTAAHRPKGYMEDVISKGIIENGILFLRDDVYRELRSKYGGKIPPLPPRPPKLISAVQDGAGTELKKLIERFGFKPKAGCKCKQHMLEMNRRGADWCEQNIDTIVGWLREEAGRAGYPFTVIGARILVNRAIKKSRQTAGRFDIA